MSSKVQTGNYLPFIILLLFNLQLPLALSSPLNITEHDYSVRRSSLIKLLEDSSAVVMKSAEIKIRNSDVEFRFRQESNFLYLTGIKNPGSYLIIIPGGIWLSGKNVKTILFKPDQTGEAQPEKETLILNSAKFHSVLKKILKEIIQIYTIYPDIKSFYDWINDRMLMLEQDSRLFFSEKNAGKKIKNIAYILSVLREIKTNKETANIRKAIEITNSGLLKAAKKCVPNAWEYDLRAAIENEMIKSGAEYPAFPTIIGSGSNSLIVHYYNDNKLMNAGDLVIIDAGTEYNGYSSDITRTLPVSGKFTATQKEIYSLVLDAQKQVIKMIKPGVTFYDLYKKTKEIFALKGMQKYLPHGISHSLGLDVHDITSSDTLKPGMVITVEPGLYFPSNDTLISERYRGIGIRIEDDVLVTEDGNKVLSESVPKEITEIENICGKDNFK